MAPKLFPRPRRVESLRGHAPADAQPTVRVDASLPAEGYRLTVEGERVGIEHADAAGLRHARSTLAALTSAEGIARCRIEDHPDVAVRGYLLDISRDRVPTRRTLALLVERLARLRFNHLQLYTEHAYAYLGHEQVWRDASPLDAADVAWLDARCAEVGIELATNQNTFGHMERWLRHEPYRAMAECPDGVARNGRTLPPTALAPTPENAAFAVELVRELRRNLTSRRVNIGCDEIFELGACRSADEVARRGRTAVFVDHVARIAGPLAADGDRVLYWADMVERDPDAARPLAELGATAVLWSYAAPGLVDPDAVDWGALPAGTGRLAERFARAAQVGFAPRVEAFAEAGLATWIAPGTSGWNSFVGRHRNARGNLRDAVDAAVTHGVEGVLVTEWGDNGHHQPPFATLPALADAGGAMWCASTNLGLTDAELADIASQLVDDASGELGRALVELGSAVDALDQPQLNEAAFVSSWVRGAFLSPIEPVDASNVRAAVEVIDGALDRVGRARPGSPDGRALVEETAVAAAMARHGCVRLLGEGSAAEFEVLVQRFRAAWAERSRPGGLEDSVAKLRRPG